MSAYDPAAIATYFDEFGTKEWERLTRSPADEIKLAIHTHYLRSYIPPQSRVLEIGAGPGRFTQVLAELGCRVVVADISPVQLDLNRQYGNELSFSTAVESWIQADICDLTQFNTASFDAVVGYGGPLSYVLDRRDDALRECIRVVRPDGLLLHSVMSLWGTIHSFLPCVLDVPRENNRIIIASGDLVPATLPGNANHCHMFRAQEFRQFLECHHLDILAMSASNSLSPVWQEKLADIRQNPGKWDELLEMELEASREAGCLDCGTHIIAVAKNPPARL
jgi:SAM-dependent methyltransferase